MSPLTEPTKLTLAKDFTWNESVWNPSMIQTALWLDAADASTITESGGAVSQWDDKSGNSRHAVQGTSSLQPAYVGNALNAKSVVSFDGIDDYLISSLSKSDFTQSQLSLFLLYAPTDTNTTRGVLSIADTPTFQQPFLLLHQASGTIHKIYVDQHYRTDYSVSTNTYLFSSFGYSGAQWEFFGDGSLVATYTGPFGSYSGNSLYLGSGYNGFAGIRVAEVIALPINASTLTRQKLEGYLAHKWGLTANLPAGHPYKTVGPTP